MKTHELKILPEFFEDVVSGRKTFEVRLNDRNYKVRDNLILREWKDGAYTGTGFRLLTEKTSYSNMSKEEIEVVDSFHGDGSDGSGEKMYSKVLSQSAFYLADPTQQNVPLIISST